MTFLSIRWYYEIMIEILSNIKFIFFIMFFIILFIFESYYSDRPWISKRFFRLLFHMKIAIINTIIIRIPTIFIIIPTLMLITENQYGVLNNINIGFLGKAILGILLLDLAFYWWHRLNHTNSTLWRFHSVHHLDTHLDVTTSLRFHFGELYYHRIYKTILILIIGMPISVFIFYEILLSACNQFHHSNIKLSDNTNKIIKKFIVTPEYHANHHTQIKLSRNANYSSIFTIWDTIFFTYKEATKKDRECLGLDDRTKEFGLIENIKHPFIS